MTHQADWQTQLTRVQQVVIAVDLSVIAASLGLFAHLVSSVMPQVAGPLAFVGAALLGAGVYGLAMTLLSAGGGYYVGHPMDMFALITAGMIALATLTPGAVIPDAAARPLARRAPVASLLPYLPLVASLFTAALLLGRADTEGDRFLTALGVTLGIALLLRQQLALRDVERLSHHLTETVMMRTHELARAQAALARAQRLEAVGRMAGGIARDFDRLIAELEAPVAILGGAIPATHPDREAVEEIAAAGRRAQRLTAQLLTFAQRQPVEPRHVDVNTVLGDALPLLRQLAGRAIAVELRHAPAPATVFADPTQLEQLLSNLTVNARDAMPDGGTLTIAVTLPGEEEPPPPDGPHGRRVRIVVQDTGVGIDEETLAHVFEPFFTTKPAGKGTGLGLSTCYGIVNRAGGRIVVESARGAGTTVMVELPRTG
jgi:signal transduction histidine kinase